MIYLIGPMGAGKSTIGRLLAARLRVPFRDLDAHIVEQAGLSIPEIFSRQGEEAFRDMESSALHESGPGVVATGGGVVLREKNRVLLQKQGAAVWLDAEPQVLAARIAGDANRPLLNGVDPLEKAKELDNMRRPLYREVADLRIDTASSTPQQAVDAITAFLSE